MAFALLPVLTTIVVAAIFWTTLPLVLLLVRRFEVVIRSAVHPSAAEEIVSRDEGQGAHASADQQMLLLISRQCHVKLPYATGGQDQARPSSACCASRSTP